MNFTAPEIFQTYWAIAAGAIFFMAPGYLLGVASGFFDFNNRSGREQTLWSVALSTPTSLVLAEFLGRTIGISWTLGCFLLIALAAAAGFLSRRRLVASSHPLHNRSFAVAVGIAVALAIVLPLETTDIQIGHRLFQSTVMYDWAVRVPVVRAAIEGVPPVNPLSALTGHASPLHYYYFWYVLVAQLCRAAHVDARAGLAASTVWAAFDFLAVLFLCLKYFVGIRERLQASCLTAMLAGCVMGLDLIPALIMLVLPGVGLNIEMEWWHPDRSPSWLSTFLYAPHHIAGIACCMLGFLAIASTADGPATDSPAKRRNIWLLHSLIAGFCFGAAAGTSTFVTLVFAIVCLLWAIRAVVKQEWITLATLALSAVIAYIPTRSFLHEMGTGGPAGHALTKFALRNSEFVALTLSKHHIAQHHLLLNYAIRTPAILLLTFAEFGFFTFVFFHQLRRDFFRHRALSRYAQAMWTIFCGAGIVAFFVSSGVDGPNDLGMHAGMILKLVLLLWATPWLDELYRRRSEFRDLSSENKILVAVAAATFAIGLGGSLYQAILERTLFAAQEIGILHKKMDTYPVTGLSYKLYDVRDAYQQAARLLPAQSILQFNPESPLQPALGLYATRQLAASDLKCGTPFGGDETLCHQIYPSLRAVFGRDDETKSTTQPARSTVNLTDLDALCRNLSISAAIATSSDPVWSDEQSWVWKRSPLYANRSVRFIPCGTAAR
jgi:hypothetical protein